MNQQQVTFSIAKIFAKYDLNQDGDLQRAEIQNILTDVFRLLGNPNLVNEADIDNFIIDYDRNHDGKLSWSDFRNMSAITFTTDYFPLKQLPHDVTIKIDQIFAKYDNDRNGVLDLGELINILQDVFLIMGINKKANQLDAYNFFKDYDNNGDGRISWEDFKTVYAISFHSF